MPDSSIVGYIFGSHATDYGLCLIEVIAMLLPSLTLLFLLELVLMFIYLRQYVSTVNW